MPLLYFLLGVIFSIFLLPILSKSSEIVITWLERFEARLGEDINESNLRIKKANMDIEDKPLRQIGFSFDDDVAEDKEEDDIDDL